MARIAGEPDEFEVAVTFYGPDWVLSVLWSTDSLADDEVRADAASQWFHSEYGFAPAAAAERTVVAPVPPGQ